MDVKDIKWKHEFYDNPIHISGSHRDFYNIPHQLPIQIGPNSGVLYDDTIAIVKLCDEETTVHLYNIPINPVYFSIRCPLGAKFKKDNDGNLLYDMLVKVDSIDDSSYGIWFYNYKLEDLQYFRKELIDYVQSEYLLSGDLLLIKAIEHGADPMSVDYN